MAIDTTARILTVRDTIVSTINSDGATFSGNVTGATNASPIVITTSAAHGLADGQDVTIASVGGNTAANGTFTVDVLTSTTFALLQSTGNGTYTSGGTWSVTRFTAKAAYDFWYKKPSLSVLQVDVRIVTEDTAAEDRTPSSEDVYHIEITVQKAVAPSDTARIDALISIAKRIAKLFYPNMSLSGLTPDVVVVSNEHELYDLEFLRDFGVFFSRISLALREYAND